MDEELLNEVWDKVDKMSVEEIAKKYPKYKYEYILEIKYMKEERDGYDEQYLSYHLFDNDV